MDSIGKGYETWWRDHREWLESFGYKLRRDLQVVPDVLYQDQKQGQLQFVRASAVDAYVSVIICRTRICSWMRPASLTENELC